MGSMHAGEFAAMTGKGKGKISIDQALTWHLQGNHYPPIPSSMLGPCKRAISAANKGNHDANIKLPEGISWRGKKSAPAHAIIEAHHLHSWVKQEEDY